VKVQNVERRIELNKSKQGKRADATG